MTMRWSILIGLLAIFIFYKGYFLTLLTIVGYVSCVTLGCSIGLYAALFTGKRHITKQLGEPAGGVLKQLLKISQSENVQPSAVGAPQTQQQHPVFTRNIDAAIEEVLEFILRDFVLSWLQDLIPDHKVITDGMKDDIWVALHNLKDRLSKIDEVKFITQDVTNKLCQHYQRIRQASCSNGKDKKPTFMLKPYLASEDAETEFLRKVAEVMVLLLAPRSYAQSMPVRHLLREVLTCSVLFPSINFVCDPDYINEKLLNYLQYHQEMLEQNKRTYTYAATYEGFIKMIHECGNVEQLRHVRYNIMTEIMHATRINNLKKSKGIDVEKEFISQGNAKGDLLQARNLGRYIKQLTLAKSVCEKRLKSLGGPDYLSQYHQLSSTVSEDDQNTSENRVIPYSVLMESDFARNYFVKFLSREDTQFLLEFYVAVEELRGCEKTKLHQLASEIYRVHFPYVNSTVKIDRSILKGMESFMIGNKGPEAFFEAKDEVYKYLEQRYYPSFIVSDVYHRMMLDADRIGVVIESSGVETEATGNVAEQTPSSEGASESVVPLEDHCTVARLKLEQLDEKLTNKLQALEAMKNSQVADDKILLMLEKEIETMREEKQQLLLHISRTDTWSENLGQWKVSLAGVEMMEEKDKTVPYFLLFVHLNGEHSPNGEEEEEEDEVAEEIRSSSWLVKRRVSDFIDLNQKLAQISAWVKHLELPKESKLRAKITSKLHLEKATSLLQNFMDTVLKDDTMNKSEALYGFLSPSPEHLKHCIPSPKKSKFSFSTLFKSNQTSSQGESSDDDELLFFDESDSSWKDDRIAEPLYTLMGEIFEMRGVFMLLRRTLISFVQITFGRTINRQLRETVSWLFSESIVVYYIHLFRDSMWPKGKLRNPKPARSDEEKLQTRYHAQEQFLNSIPEILNHLVGQQNARKGAKKVFESLQDARLNKQLFYEMLEMLVLEIFPEVKK